jgi:uncharacterized protein YndB with AHSA1/START domain
MVAPLLQAQVDINAPASKVWALISDFRRMPQWSQQCRWMRPFGPLRPGTRTLNLNRRNRMFWTTTCTVVEVIPEKKLSFCVNTNRTIWSYELEPSGQGTRVIESRHAENGVAPSLPHTPNIAPSDPASGRKKPQSRHTRLVDRDIDESGP